MIPYPPDSDNWVSEDAEVLETGEPVTSENNGSDGSNGDRGGLLANVRDGAWLDQQVFPPLVYPVDGLIPEGFGLIVGSPKAGKSWLFAGLLAAVASGGRALGHIQVGTARPVFYLALEDGDRRMQFRLRKLLAGDPIPERFRYITTVQPGLVLATIEAFLDSYPDTGLVVLDTLGKVMPEARQGESAYQRDYRIGGSLKRIADEHPGLAVVVVHHQKKAAAEDFVDSVSGTNGLAGSADTIMVLDRKRHATEGLLKITGRDVPEAEYALTTASGHWTLDGRTLAEAADNARRRGDTDSLGDTSAAIVAFVAKHRDGLTAKAIQDEFKDVGVGTYLKRLTDSGRLVKLKRGIYATPDELPLEPLEPLEPQVKPGARSNKTNNDTPQPSSVVPIRRPRRKPKGVDS